MLTFFRPQQLPRTTEAGLVLASDQKEGPSSSHTATENIYTAGTLEPWGRPALLQGPALGQWEGVRRGKGGPGASGECRRSKDGAKDNDRYELTVTHPLFPLSQKSCLPPPPFWWKDKIHTRVNTKHQKDKHTCMHRHSRTRKHANIHVHICMNQMKSRYW